MTSDHQACILHKAQGSAWGTREMWLGGAILVSGNFIARDRVIEGETSFPMIHSKVRANFFGVSCDILKIAPVVQLCIWHFEGNWGDMQLPWRYP